MGSRGDNFKNNGVPKNLKAEDLYFMMFQNDGGHNWNVWELDDSEILTVGYDEKGNAYEVDKKGNPTKRLKEDPNDSLEMIGEGLTLSDAKKNFASNADQQHDEWEEDPWNHIDDNEDNHKKF